MMIIMKTNATPQQVEAVIASVKSAGLNVHLSQGVEATIIGAIGDMDGALSPDQKGSLQFKRWLARESPEQRQKFRDEVLNTKPSDFQEFAERLRALKDPSSAVVSSKAAFEDANKAGKAFTLKEIM